MNIYAFDYNMVVKLDPSYMQYLEDLNHPDVKEDIKTIELTRYPDAGNIMEMVDTTDVDASEWEELGLKKEEWDIIRKMHVKKAKPLERYQEMIQTMVERLDIPKRYLEPEYFLKEQYRNNLVGTPNPNLLMIGPPKTMLRPGSSFWANPDTFYRVTLSEERNKDVVTLQRNKFYQKDDKVGIIRALYRFDRFHNSASEMRKYFQMVVYNLKTAQMYFIRGMDNGTRKRVTKKLTSLGLNLTGVQATLSNMNTDLVVKFVQVMIDHITSIIPDVWLPNTWVTDSPLSVHQKVAVLTVNGRRLESRKDYANLSLVAYALMIQHKVGRRLEWLGDESFRFNVAEFAGSKDLSYQLLGIRPASSSKEIDQSKRSERSIRRKTVYKVIPNLKLRPGAKTVTRSLFGPFYRDFYHKIMTWKSGVNITPVSFLADISYTLSKGIMQKDMYHLIVSLVRREDEFAFSQLTHISTLLSAMRNGDPWEVITDTNHELMRTVELYVRTIRNAMNYHKASVSNDGNDAFSWLTFRDTCNMARDLGIRIRVNKFKSMDDIQQFHDRLAFFQQRDLEVRNSYSDYTFLPFKSPEKEYDGFRFIQLMTPAELVNEGRTMHHCVGGYSRYCLNGDSIIYSMFKNRSWVTIELNGDTLSIRQKYTIKDYTVESGEANDLIDKWHKDLAKMHNEDKESYKILANRFFEYQKTKARIQKLEEIDTGDMNEDERSLMNRSLTQAEEELKSLSYGLFVSEARGVLEYGTTDE